MKPTPIGPRLWPYILRDVTPLAERPWNIDQANAPSFWTRSKGGGAVVAVIDTGLDITHPEFAGRIFKPKNLTRPGEPVTDIQGHGTHVAGIIAGRTCGVAPEARIMPLQVFGAGDVGLNIQEAFRVVLQHNRTAAEADKVVAVNCSFGSSAYDPILAYLIRSLVSQGVTVVCAAGNQGDGDPTTHEIFSFPAYIYECLTVGATNQDGQPAGYSNSFDGIDLGAPGTEIYSAWPGGQYKLMSGTSMSGPHVSGAMALIYDAWRQREGAWPSEEQAVSILLRHVRTVDADPFLVGAGVLDLTYSAEKLTAPAEEVTLWVGKTTAIVDGRKVSLDQPPEINPLTSRAVVPLRFVGERFGYQVGWDDAEKRIDLVRRAMP